ncbi:MAG: NUDIX domain-containing protein [Patescibacteria group bacterium]|nr:NUDIX domain-containing protein [Patescibacteria group bacterium]
MKISKIKGIYVENEHKIKNVYLKNKTYSKAMESMIVVCSDVMIFNRKEKAVYLAKRRVKPMKGLWEIGGRRFAGETALKAAVRNFTRETTLKIKSSRLKFITTIENIWQSRKEKPIKIGKHDLIFVFAVNLNKKEIEIVSKNLGSKEYHQNSLEKFDKKRLLKEKVHPALIEIYNKIFN